MRQTLGAAPSRTTDEVTKTYVDNAVASAGGGVTETRTTTAAGTTSLTSASSGVQVFTGTNTQTVTLPTTSVTQAMQWMILNNSTGAVTVNASDGTTVLVLATNTSALFGAAVDTPITSTDWDVQYGGVSVSSGKTLTVPNTMTLTGTDAKSYNLDALGGLSVALTANVTTTTTDTKVLSLSLAANTLAVGSTFEGILFGTSTGSATPTGNLHLGTAGTTADASVVSKAGSAAVPSGDGLEVRILFQVRAIGTSASGIGNLIVSAQTANPGSFAYPSPNTTVITFNSTVANFLTLSIAMSATVVNAYIRQVI